MLTGRCTQTSDDLGGDSGDRVGDEAERPTIRTRLASAKDIVDYYGEPQRGTIKALVALMDGELVGIAGVIRDGYIGRYFVDFKDELQPHLQSITLWRAIKESHRFCDEYRGPILAVAEHAEGHRLLNKLGWTHLEGDLYGWVS